MWSEQSVTYVSGTDHDSNGRTGGIWTHDLHHPKVARYRAAPRSDDKVKFSIFKVIRFTFPTRRNQATTGVTPFNHDYLFLRLNKMPSAQALWGSEVDWNLRRWTGMSFIIWSSCNRQPQRYDAADHMRWRLRPGRCHRMLMMAGEFDTLTFVEELFENSFFSAIFYQRPRFVFHSSDWYIHGDGKILFSPLLNLG